MSDSFSVQPKASKKRASNTSRNSYKGPSNKRSNGSTSLSSLNKSENVSAGSDNDDFDSADESLDDSENNSGADSASDSDASEVEESAADKRRRLAKEYLAGIEEEVADGFDAKDLDEDIISRRLKQDADKELGYIFRNLLQCKIHHKYGTRSKAKHLTCVTVCGENAYIGSKNGTLEIYDVNNKPKLISSRRLFKSSIYNVAVNDTYLVAATKNKFCVYNKNSLEPVKEFKVKGDVLSLSFRKRTNELYVGGTDLRLRTYDLTQLTFVETLHGHQDSIMDISALYQERCVSVGARDRTCIYWKIPEESRLTFRGGDTKIAAQIRNSLSQSGNKRNEDTDLKTIDNISAYETMLEGSIDCCVMMDNQFFVTGSDNGNVCLWSTSKKKAQFILPIAHGYDPALTPAQASGETDPSIAEIPPPQPRSITAITAIPMSNMFITGSWSGTVKLWTMSDDRRQFQLVEEVPVGKGIVTGLSVIEIENEKETFAVVATLAREPRLGRWKVVPGHDTVVQFRVST